MLIKTLHGLGTRMGFCTCYYCILQLTQLRWSKHLAWALLPHMPGFDSTQKNQSSGALVSRFANLNFPGCQLKFQWWWHLLPLLKTGKLNISWGKPLSNETWPGTLCRQEDPCIFLNNIVFAPKSLTKFSTLKVKMWVNVLRSHSSLYRRQYYFEFEIFIAFGLSLLPLSNGGFCLGWWGANLFELWR